MPGLTFGNPTRSRSYLVREEIPEGHHAIITGASTPMQERYIGQQVRILIYNNAGFQGIQAWVQTQDYNRFHISAGHLAKP